MTTPDKVRFRDALAAKLALSKIATRDKPGHTEQSTYRCRCGAWHLTSKGGYVR